MALAYLLDPCLQHQNREGVNNVAGWFEVFLNGTDDRAQVYSDFDGTLCPEHIVIDNNGRCVIIADSSKAYRVEMYGPNGDLIYTQYPVWCMSAGDGNDNHTDVISSDGTVNVVKSVAGGTTTFDLSTDTEDEPSKYGERACSITNIEGGDWVELDPGDIGGTMGYNEGWFLDKDCTIDIAASVEWTSKNATALYGIDVKAVFTVDGVAVSTEYGAVDPTVDGGRTCFEWKGACKEEQYVDCHIFVKCAVDVELPLSGRIYVNEECDGIVGSNGGASYMAGEYIQITPDHVINATGLQPVSAMSAYAYESSLSSFVQNSAFSSYSAGVNTAITAMSSDISSLSATVSGLTGQYLEQSASALFQPFGNYVSSTEMSAYLPMSAIAGDGGKVTAIDGSAVRGHEYSGLGAIVVDNVNDTIKVNTTGLAVDGDTMSAWVSGDDVVIGVKGGVYAYESSNSAKLDTSAFSSVSGTFLTAVPTGYALESYVDSAVSGKLDSTASSQFITSTAGLATTGDVESAVSGKMDSSASGEFYPMTGNPSGFLTAHQSLAGLATETYVDSAVSGKLDSSAYDSAQFYLTSNPSGFISNADLSNYATTAYVDSSVSGKLDATASSQFLTSTAGLVGTGDLTAYAFESSNSAKLDTTAFSDVSGNFLTAVPAGYATTADISGFAYESAVSGWTAKQDSLTFGYDGSNNISSIDGSAIGGQGGIDSATCSAIASAYAESAVSSVSGNYYPATSNPSGYALSSDVSATVDLVGTQSANWGGSALALSAGPGVKLEKVGNTLVVASTDETVLWSGNITASNGTGTLAYPPSAFADLKIEWYGENTGEYGLKCSYFHNDGLNFSGLACGGIGQVYNNYAMGNHFGYLTLTNSTVTLVRQCRYNLTTTGLGAFESGNGMFRVQRIIGINRTAEA